MRAAPLFLVVALGANFSVACSGEERNPCSNEEFQRLAAEAATMGEQGGYREAFRLSLKCANSGLDEAQFSLGVLLDADRGNELVSLSEEARDRACICWIHKAALQGHEEAALFLADSYESGWRRLEKQPASARCWRSAAGDSKLAAMCASPSVGPCELEVESQN